MIQHRRTLVAPLGLLVAVAAIAAPAAGQDDPWRFAVRYEHTSMRSDLPQWTDWHWLQAGVQHRFDRGAVAVDAFRSERFDLTDDGVAADVYAELWSGAYANARWQVVPDADVLAEHDVRVELFQVLSGGWEPAAAVRRFVFPAETVDVVSGALGKYLPGWYVRARADWVPSSSEPAWAFGGMIRRYLAESEGFVEASVTVGEEVVEVAAGPAVDVRPGWNAGLRGELFPRARLGISLGASYADVEGLPVRTAVTVGLILLR